MRKGKEERRLAFRASDRRCIIAGMHSAFLSICGSNGVVFTWQGCVGVAEVGCFI